MRENFYKTFTGTDALVFIMMPNCTPVCLGSITTLSYSLIRNKTQVETIGRVNIGGFTRGTRLVAGTMIFTMLNQNWVNELVDQLPWLGEYKNIKADELPIFDLMIVCANEYGASVSSFIYGVDIAEEGQVLSIEEVFTESTCRFIARDIDVFKENKLVALNTSAGATTVSNFTVGQASNISTAAYTLSTANNVNDISTVQNELSRMGYDVGNTGVYDNNTIAAVMEYQKENNINATGYIDSITYNSIYGIKAQDLTNNSSFDIPIYKSPDINSDIVRMLAPLEVIKEYSIKGDYISMAEGYIVKKDLNAENPYTIEKSIKSLIVNETMDNILTTNNINFKFSNVISDLSIKVSAISYYPDNSNKVISKMVYLNKGDSLEISSLNIQEAFIYNSNTKSLPVKVEFLVAPLGYNAEKIIINIK